MSMDPLRDHMYGPDPLKPFNCDTCRKGFDSVEKLRRHDKKHNVYKPFWCYKYQCEQKFANFMAWTRHKSEHRDSKPFRCNVCNCTYSNSSSLRRHKKKKHSLESRGLAQCDVCDKIMRISYIKVMHSIQDFSSESSEDNLEEILGN